ncbi:hypothetical protein FWF93_02610 [Candidatus Saccharibacteria bacterium]|nr:hypothetical protein [Candidatus Saccharibacteria bacterium]
MSETVTIKGVLYEAATGLPVKVAKKPAPSVKTLKPGEKLARGVVGERVVIKKTSATKPAVAVKKRSPAKVRGSARSRRPQKSVTLSRRYVTKPIHAVHVSAPRSTTVKKHPEVSHFNNGTPLPSPVRLPVKPASQPKPRPKTIVTPKNLMTDVHRVAPQSKSHSKPLAKKPESARALPLEEIDHVFSEVTKSISQEIKKDVKKIKKSPKSFYIITGIVAVVLIAGIVAIFRLPQLEMLIASHYAKVDGHIPTYVAPGYYINGSISYSPEQVHIKYRNDRQGEEYTLVESKTTEADADLVISGNTAVFTKDGIRYQIIYSALSEEQVRRIADSL